MTPYTQMTRAYRKWCEEAFPGYTVKDFPLRGRLFETWRAAWFAALEHKGETQ